MDVVGRKLVTILRSSGGRVERVVVVAWWELGEVGL